MIRSCESVRDLASAARMSGGFAMVRAMRLLHTSDWHLGRSLHKADLRDAQERFLDHLVETARAERVDAVLIAGDVYDRAVPPVDAVALCEQALVRLRDTGARVVVISGNHDSARRLGFSSALIDASGVHLRTRPATLAEPVMLRDDHGPVAVYGVPYLEPAVGLPGFDGPRAHPAVLGEAAARIRADADGARRGAHGRDGARLGGRGRGQRLRAGHLGRRCRLRPGEPVRRVQLRGARPPARPADDRGAHALQRLAAAVLVLRGAPQEGQLAGRGRRRRQDARRTGPRAGLPEAHRAPRPPRGSPHRVHPTRSTRTTSPP